MASLPVWVAIGCRNLLGSFFSDSLALYRCSLGCAITLRLSRPLPSLLYPSRTHVDTPRLDNLIKGPWATPPFSSRSRSPGRNMVLWNSSLTLPLSIVSLPYLSPRPPPAPTSIIRYLFVPKLSPSFSGLLPLCSALHPLSVPCLCLQLNILYKRHN